MTTITEESEEIQYAHGQDDLHSEQHATDTDHHDAPLFGEEVHGAEEEHAGAHATNSDDADADAARKKKLKRNSNIITGVGGAFIVGILGTFAWPYVFPKQNHVVGEQEIAPKLELQAPKQTPLPVAAPVAEQSKPAPSSDQGNMSPATLAAQPQTNVATRIDPINAEQQAQIDRMKAKDAAFSNGAAQDNPFASASAAASATTASTAAVTSNPPTTTVSNGNTVASNPSIPAGAQKHAHQANDVDAVVKTSNQQKQHRHAGRKLAQNTKKKNGSEPKDDVESAGTSAPAAISGLWVRATYPSTGTPAQAWIQDEGKLTIVRVGDMIKGARVTKLDGLTVVTTAGKINPQ